MRLSVLYDVAQLMRWNPGRVTSTGTSPLVSLVPSLSTWTTASGKKECVQRGSSGYDGIWGRRCLGEEGDWGKLGSGRRGSLGKRGSLEDGVGGRWKWGMWRLGRMQVGKMESEQEEDQGSVECREDGHVGEREAGGRGSLDLGRRCLPTLVGCQAGPIDSPPSPPCFSQTPRMSRPTGQVGTC